MKLCKDCKWYIESFICTRPPQGRNIHPVTDEATESNCIYLRKSVWIFFPLHPDTCGELGRFWEKKDATEKG